MVTGEPRAQPTPPPGASLRQPAVQLCQTMRARTGALQEQQLGCIPYLVSVIGIFASVCVWRKHGCTIRRAILASVPESKLWVALLLLQARGMTSTLLPLQSSRCAPCTGTSGLRRGSCRSSTSATPPASGKRLAAMAGTLLASSGAFGACPKDLCASAKF